jgi:hypothetical protein
MAGHGTGTVEDVWFHENDTYCAMRFWASDFSGKPAGSMAMHDVKFIITHDYPGGLDAFIDNYVDDQF